jgi:pimeloyl-ACP methyl ester carboxylesterase
MMGSQLDTASG